MTNPELPPAVIPPPVRWFPPQGKLGFFMGLAGMVLLEVVGISVLGTLFAVGMDILRLWLGRAEAFENYYAMNRLMNNAMWPLLLVLAGGLAWVGRHSPAFVAGVVVGGLTPLICTALMWLGLLFSGGMMIY